MKHLLPIILAFVASIALHAQEGAGRTFLLAFPDTTTNTTDYRFPNRRFTDRALVVIYSAVDTRVRITGNGYERVELIRKGGSAVVDLFDSTRRAPDPIVTRSNRVVGNSFRLEADSPVIVYCFLLTKFGAEAWTPLPVESWGREYFVAAWPGEIAMDISTGGQYDYNRRPKMAPAEIAVVAAYDDTRVTINSTAKLLGAPRLIAVTLDAGEVYQVQTLVDTSVYADLQPDAGGSRITASRPIGVISGNTRAQVLPFQEGLGQNIFKNMLLEWLSPVEMHGTEFVYLPAWDTRRPTGAPGEDLSSKRKGEFVRLHATTPGGTRGFSLDNNIGRTSFTIAAAGRFREDFIGTPEARHYITDYPVEAMMSSTAIVRYHGGTFDTASVRGAEFDGWSAFMIEMVPRHRWSSFAPYYAPDAIDSMEHFINVVTDSVHGYDVYMENGARFDFNRGTIEGSGLVWGTMEVTPGRVHTLEGRNGARFSGQVYGLARGHEEYRVPANPSEYEEYLAVSYGYPLSSSHRGETPSGSLDIDTTRSCSATTITITETDSAAARIASITLEWANNARIASIDPMPSSGTATVTLVMAPIDADRDAAASIVIKDAAGNITRHRYTEYAERISVVENDRKRDAVYVYNGVPGVVYTWPLRLVNPLDRAIRVEDIKLDRGDQRYAIVSMSPKQFPRDLAPGDSINVTIEAKPVGGDRTFRDTLSIVCGCRTTRVPFVITTSSPGIVVDDIDFGTFVGLGANSSERIWIRNSGTGTLLFTGGAGADPISLLHPQHFVVAEADLQRLRSAEIRSGDSMAITVSFRGISEGVFADTVRFLTNDIDGKSYAIWRASVRRISGIDNPIDIEGAGAAVTPNPASGVATITFRMLNAADASLLIRDAMGRQVLLRDLGTLAAGEHRIDWSAMEMSAGIYLYQVRSGTQSISGTVAVVR